MVLILIGLALVVALVFSLNLNQERKYDITSLKGDVDGHFQAIQRRLDDIDEHLRLTDERVKSHFIRLTKSEGTIEDVRCYLSERFEQSDAKIQLTYNDVVSTQKALDLANDELFSVKSALQALGQKAPQKKKKAKRSGKRR